ncbi:MAG: methyltransferase domain-containing protein [Calditrichaeota bacterium]|nr:MAG: methyltransferase domain-containing protein [Calditrichota bacterium]
MEPNQQDLMFSPEAQRTDSLYQYLSRRYALRQETVSLGEHRLHFFRVADPDRVIDRVLEAHADPDEHIPYWAELWPSALALGKFLFEQQPDLEGRRLLDLGSGSGYTGLVAGLLGAGVVFSDNQPDALRLCELNWWLNFHRPAQFWQMDWRNPPPVEPFPVILASDVAYERRLFQPLAAALDQLLAPEGVIYLSEPNRALARGFFQMLAERGFSWDRAELAVPGPSSKAIAVSLYTIRRK